MPTNNPPIAAWAPSTALAKLASRHNNSPCVLTDSRAEFNEVPLIRLSDYERLQADHERLQAECAQLRKDAERYQFLRSYPRHGLRVRNDRCQLHDVFLDRAIDEAIAGDQP